MTARSMYCQLLLLPGLVALAASATAHDSGREYPNSSWEFGAVLDAAHTSKKLELGYRDKNLGLGHSDLMIRGPLGAAFTAEGIFAAHTVDDRLETHTERFVLRSRNLPGGLSLAVGRFASQIGYLNEQHPHADDFSERPLLYRGFLGNHWFDDGLRLNWTAPTPFYLRFGAEAFSGKQLIKEAETKPKIGTSTVSLKTGGDLNQNNSWQLGLSYLNNRRQAEVHTHSEGESAHEHLHGASFSGRRMWMTDLVYKWAPDGNPKNQQIRLIWEQASVARIHPDAAASLRHSATALAAVWRFRPAWELGAKTDWLRVNKPEREEDGDPIEFGAARLREHAMMIAYKPSHMQTYRLQFSRQRADGADAAEVFANPVRNVVMFQVVLGFGAHGAHSY
jgi:hypothetical protein